MFIEHNEKNQMLILKKIMVYENGTNYKLNWVKFFLSVLKINMEHIQ